MVGAGLRAYHCGSLVRRVVVDHDKFPLYPNQAGVQSRHKPGDIVPFVKCRHDDGKDRPLHYYPLNGFREAPETPAGPDRDRRQALSIRPRTSSKKTAKRLRRNGTLTIR
jgi:hypothetical protein